MATERVNVMMSTDIKADTDAERKKLSPPETRSRFLCVSAKDRVRRIRRKRARNETA